MPKDLDEEIIRRKAQRFEILQDLYRRKLDGYDQCEVAWIAQDVRMDLGVALEHLNFLRQHGLVGTTGWSQKPVVFLTHSGEVEVELVRGGQATPDFPVQVLNYVNVGHMYQSQIQQGTEHSTANLSVADFESIRPTFESFVRSLRESFDQLGLDAESRADLERELATAGVQLNAKKPNPGVLREVLKSTRSILENATGELVAQYLPQIAMMLSTLGN